MLPTPHSGLRTLSVSQPKAWLEHRTSKIQTTLDGEAAYCHLHRRLIFVSSHKAHPLFLDASMKGWRRKTLVFILLKQWFSKCSLQFQDGKPKTLSGALGIIPRCNLSFSLCWHLHRWWVTPQDQSRHGHPAALPAPEFSTATHVQKTHSVPLHRALVEGLTIINCSNLDHYMSF